QLQCTGNSQNRSNHSQKTHHSPSGHYQAPHSSHSHASMQSTRQDPMPRRTFGPPDGPPSHSGHSSSNRSVLPRDRKVAKSRTALSDKIQWDGQCSTFRPYRDAIKGHLIQNGAGYLVNPSFHQSYVKYSKQDKDYLESEDFRVTYPEVSAPQARLDRSYLYGMLLSSNRKDGERKIILKYDKSQDGIAAWIEFLRDYDNNGSEEI
ncbi:MAG TPA: hypothetical protein V6D48_21980, partial [Oculatellaceae cyanobacterium]